MDELARTVAVPRFKRAADVARAVFGAALDLALPRVCAACREPVKGQGLCPACWSNLSFITRPYCERLGIPLVHDPGPRILSLEAIADPPAYQRSRAAVRFDDISRALVHGLKYSDRLDPAPMMGRWLCHAGREVLGGRPRPGTAAPAQAVGATFQPIVHARRRGLGRERCSDRRRSAQARGRRPLNKSGFRGRSVRRTYRALSAYSQRARQPSPAAGSSWSTTY